MLMRVDPILSHLFPFLRHGPREELHLRQSAAGKTALDREFAAGQTASSRDSAAIPASRRSSSRSSPIVTSQRRPAVLVAIVQGRQSLARGSRRISCRLFSTRWSRPRRPATTALQHRELLSQPRLDLIRTAAGKNSSPHTGLHLAPFSCPLTTTSPSNQYS